MRVIPIALLIVASSGVTMAQEVAQIRGRVLDAETGKAIPFASVYFNSTTIGTTADSVGNYSLKNIPTHYTDLVFSSIGYESFLYKVSLASQKIVTLDVKLKPSKKILKEIVVKGKRDKKWKENYDRFFKEFIGSGSNAALCKIENPEVLDFYVAGNVLKATASHPLEVTNQALGYNIIVSLEQVELGFDYYRVAFHSRFLRLRANSERQEFKWQVNRTSAYKGSLRHFLKSVIEKRSEAEGFRVYVPITIVNRNGGQVDVKPTKEVSVETLFPEKISSGRFMGFYQMLKKGVFEIHYLNQFTAKSKRVYRDFGHPVSWLEVYDDHLLCPFTGILRSNSNTMVSGDMGQNRLADALPEDYDPAPDEGRIFLAKHAAGSGTIRGVVIDSASGQGLTSAFIFINNSLFKTSSYRGEFELKDIPEGTYTLVAAYGNYSTTSQKIVVRGDGTQDVKLRISSKPLEPWAEPLYYEGTPVKDIKRMLFSSNFIEWHPLATFIQNLDALDIRFLDNRTQMRSNAPLEIADNKTGYKLKYYLKSAEILPGRKGKKYIQGYASFDTLQATSFKEREKWVENRDEYFRGTIDHFVRVLTEGRSKEEGYDIYTLGTRTVPGKKRRVKRVLEPLAGDSILVMSKENRGFELTIPENTFVRFDGGGSNKMEAKESVPVSPIGFVSDQSGITVTGPMRRKPIPLLPVEYEPANTNITDPTVLVFIKGNDLSALQQMVEKTYLHTDKDYYYPGEKIWYKVYLRYGSRQLRDSLSKVLHVELISPEKRVIRNEILNIENGASWGDIALPDSLKPGTYYLRAYTKWAMNFGSEYISTKPIPILSTEQNLEQEELKQKSGSNSNLDIQTDKKNYKPRELIVVKIKMDSKGEPTKSNLSVSVTDADKVVPGNWTKTIVEDSLHSAKGKWKYKRVSYPIEKAFVYDCYVKKELTEGAATVLITPMRGKLAASTRPGKDGRFNFRADFADTASFIFRAGSKSGNFAGHVFIEQPKILPINLPPGPDLSLRKDDAKYRIKYSYDPNEKTTMLEEVVVRGSRIEETPKRSYTKSIVMTPDHIFEANSLNVISESVQDPISFWQLMADKIPGARPDPDNLIILRRAFPTFFKVNNLDYSVDQMKALSPTNIERIEVYNLLALVNIYLKTGPDLLSKAKEFDRYTLTGFASPSKFYMRDYSKSSSENELPDFRTTIYWKPDLEVDGEESTISFYAADMPGRYRIVAEGLTDDGRPLYSETMVEVAGSQ